MPDTRIREIRQSAGLTLQDVAEKVGTTAVTVGRWEREPQRVTLPVLANLADALGVSQAELLGQPAVAGLSEGHLQTLADRFGVPLEHFAVLVQGGDFMAPTIIKGHHCYLDGRVKSLGAAGLYGITAGHDAVAVVVRGHTGTKGDRVMADNPVYRYDERFPAGSVKVIGRVVGYTRHI